MSGFLSDLWANVIGTFVGAALALFSSWWLQRRGVAARERRLLQGVVDRIYRSRALAPARSREPAPLSESEMLDRHRCAASIIATRDRIATVSDELDIYTHAADILHQMFVHCLEYLEAADEAPDDYVSALMTLRASFVDDLHELAQAVPDTTFREPGTAKARTGL